ncbi:unnamed protein product [Diamesa hyperborea]
MLLGETSSIEDLLNDSAEVMDSPLNSDAEDGLGGGLSILQNSAFGGSRFDEFVLPDDLPQNTGTIKPKLDDFSNKNIYKVPKSKTKKAPTMNVKSMSSKSDTRKHYVNDFNSEKLTSNLENNKTHLGTYNNYFQAFTSLYEHNLWKAETLAHYISKECLSDLTFYLQSLKESKEWALKTTDSSGRYQGQYFFGNDYWLGSKTFCKEVNYMNGHTNPEIPQMYFFVAKILVKLEPVFHKEPKLLQVGQCLPKTCTPQDVTAILNKDPAAIMLQHIEVQVNIHSNETKATSANELLIFDLRKVPGEYSIWHDQKFYVFGSIVVTIIILIIVASIYESALEAKGFIFDGKNIIKINLPPTPIKANLDGNCNLNSMDKYEMNQINNNDNNNLNDGECMQNKTFVKSTRELGFLSKLLLCFAYGSNSKIILTAKTTSEDSLTCIHGMRFFTVLWTVMVHTYLQVFAIGENRFNRIIAERTFIYQIVGNATFSVDTFFFISGLLVVLLFLRSEKSKKMKMEENCNENLINHGSHNKRDGGFFCASLRKSFLFIFYRFLRLSPVYLFIMAFTELSMKMTYNQSVFSPALADHVNCNEYWWRNILFINNFYPLTEMCMMWSWYLANDMQFYIIAMVLLILSTRYFKFSAISIMLVLLSSWILSICISLHFEYRHKVAEPFESFDVLYDKPWQRIGPYIMGMIAGYILYRVKTPPKIPVVVNLMLWSCSLGIIFIIVFGVWEGQLSLLMTSLYVSLGHSAWGLALIWITLSCCWGTAKPINSFLSYNGFLPLSRLTYCAYLIHPTVMMITSFQMEAPMHLQHVIVLTSFLGNAVVSFLFAFILSLMFEAPVIRLLKICFKK